MPRRPAADFAAQAQIQLNLKYIYTYNNIIFNIFFTQPENSSASGGNRCDKRSRQTQMVIIVKI
jgi:hypothetical protein